MKKVMLTVSAFALVAMMAACGNAKSDGEAMGKKLCECQKLATDASKAEDATKCGKEAEEMAKSHQAKYEKDSAATVEYMAGLEAGMKTCSNDAE